MRGKTPKKRWVFCLKFLKTKFTTHPSIMCFRLSKHFHDHSMTEENQQEVIANGTQKKETPKIAKMGASKGSKEEPPENMPSSLFILSEENLIRRAARATINSMAFEYTILAAILANCIVMAMEEHLPEKDKSVFTEKLDKTENYFLAIFSTETFLKIIAQGFVLHPGSYMRNAWNSMDFFVVTTGLVLSLFSTSFEMINNWRYFVVESLPLYLSDRTIWISKS